MTSDKPDDAANLPERRAPVPAPAAGARPRPRARTDVVHRVGLISAALTVLGLDYAALDDLLTTADGIFPEFFFLIGSIPLLAFIWQRWKRRHEEE
ncbi:MAG: hypothetical protein HYT81_04615 [Gemmatimonadetes bacterium]|nr:hypothetical protein [Gemmatimonadota bacterium]MBI2401286.1 hypothetical protein [Gemmatimonadota bacterium]